MKEQGQNLVWACTNHSKQSNVSTNYKKQFFMKGQGQIWCGLAQITINKAKGVLA
jgi:hypothetical protein